MWKSLSVYKTYLALGAKVYVINRARSRAFIRRLNQLLESKGYPLSTRQAERIRQYTIQSCITNSWFTTLRGNRPTPAETQRALYLGAFTPVYDDLMDQQNHRHEELMKVICQEKPPTTPDLFLLKQLYDSLLEITNNPKTFKEALSLVGKSQNQSMLQSSHEKIDHQTLWKVTKDKGGHATLLYRSVLSHPLLPGEQKAIFQLGSLLQLTNDLFDVYKDHQNGFQP